MTERQLFSREEYEVIQCRYEKIVENCLKATEIDPKNAEAWHFFSQTNEEAALHFSRLYSMQ